MPDLWSFIGSDVTVSALRTGDPSLICRRTERVIRGVNCGTGG